MDNITITRESDARGSFCPVQLMELIRIVRDAKIGDVLAVISGDDGSKKDIPLWLTKAKHELLGTEAVEGATRFICRKTH